jgi:hypothetical protein
MTEPTIEEKTSYCDSVPCTIHDHSDWLDRVKDYNSNQPTIREKMEKILTDETFNPEPCDIRLFATNIARRICEEMMDTNCSCRNCPETKQKAQEILKALE